MDSFLRNLRYGLRVLAKDPGFAAVALLTLALGIGATTAMFSVVSRVLLRPLPFQDPGRLVLIKERIPKVGPQAFDIPAPDVLTFSRENRAFEGVAGFVEQNYDLTGVGLPQRIAAARVGWNLFSVLGVPQLMGRGFVAEEDHPDSHVVVVSYRFWKQRLGGASDVLGRTVELDRTPYTILGVMPADFEFPVRTSGTAPELWVPMGFTDDEKAAIGDNFQYGAVARLKPGVTREQADADVQAVAQRIYESFPAPLREAFQMFGTTVPLREDAVLDVRKPLLILLAAVVSVLLIAVVNVANLLLARGSARQRELAIRLALGAAGRTLVAQLLTESVLLGVIGGGIGLLLAAAGTDALVAMVPAGVPRLQGPTIDLRVLLFTCAISLLAGLAFGTAPALFALRSDLNDALKAGGRAGVARPHQRLRSVLVVAQVALALVLLIGAGLLMRSFQRVLAVNPGFRPQHVLTATVSLPGTQYQHASQMQSFFTDAVDRLQHLPGANAVGASTDLPLEAHWQRIFSIEGYQPPPGAGFNIDTHSAIVGDYFGAMGIPIVRGRPFTRADSLQSPLVVIISESIAKQFFAGQNPIGHRLKWGPMQSDAPWMTIVGVAGEVKQGALDTTTLPHTYTPYLQLGDKEVVSGMNLALRSAGDPASAASALRAAVWSLDRQLPVTQVRTMKQVVGDSLAPRRFNMLLMIIFAGTALLLAAIGLYGVLSYSVAQRTHEIGVRMTLGARRQEVLRTVLGSGLSLTCIGLAAGLAGALAASRLLTSFLFGIAATDPLTYFAVAAVLLATALLASYVPAWRATKVDPIVALRQE